MSLLACFDAPNNLSTGTDISSPPLLHTLPHSYLKPPKKMSNNRTLLLKLFLLSLSLFNGILAATPGCGKTPTLKNGINTLTVNSKTRQWTLALPANYNNTNPYRLIFGVHWLGGSMNDVAVGNSIQPYYGLRSLANESTIFVAPDGLNKGWGNQGGEDIQFIRQILEATNADLCINEKLRFSVGFSYGAAMSHSIACTLSSDFRGVAAISGGSLSGCVGGKEPVAYYGLHGLSDNVLPIAGGRALRDVFVRNNGCAASPAPAEVSSGSKSHSLSKFEGCKEGYPVWWSSFDSGHSPVPADGGGDSRDRTWTPKAVWEFFSQFQ